MRKLTKTAAVVASMAVMAMGTTVMASAAQEGWVQSGSTWYYYVKGEAVENQWVQAGDKWYFLGEDGKMVRDAFVQDGEELDENDLEDLDATDDDAIYYVGSDGAMITGWKKIDLYNIGATNTPKNSNKWYYFGGSGEMFGQKWVQAGDKWYFLGTDGAMMTNSYDDDEGDCYLNKDGEWVTGWYKTTDKDVEALGGIEEDEWVYFDSDGELAEDCWMKVDGNWYYFGAVTQSAYGINSYTTSNVAASQMASDVFIQVDKDNFHLKSNGAMETGWFTVKDEENNKNKYYANSSGVIQKNKVQSVSSKNYYLDADGIDRSDDYDYAYSYKTLNGTKYTTTYKPIANASTLTAAKEAIDEAETAGTSVTIYKLKSSTTYTYTAK